MVANNNPPPTSNLAGTANSADDGGLNQSQSQSQLTDLTRPSGGQAGTRGTTSESAIVNDVVEGTNLSSSVTEEDTAEEVKETATDDICEDVARLMESGLAVRATTEANKGEGEDTKASTIAELQNDIHQDKDELLAENQECNGALGHPPSCDQTTSTFEAAVAASLSTTSSISPPRNGRGERLARKREQIAGCQQSPTGAARLPDAPVPSSPPNHAGGSIDMRTRLPLNSSPECSPPRASMPGDYLIPSHPIISRARPPAQPAVIPETPPRGPLPPGPRLKGAATSAAAAGERQNNTLEEMTPGAYQERARAIGDLPTWAHQEAATGTRTVTGATVAGGNNSPPESSPERVEDSNAFSPPSEIEMSGLASAEPVTDAETVVYAEDVKEDELTEARHKMVVLGLVAVVIIIGLVVVLLLVVFAEVEETSSACDLPIKEQTISTYCQCQGTGAGFMEHLNKKDGSLFLRYELIKEMLKGKEWMRQDVDWSVGSCEQENMVAQSMARLLKDQSVEEFNESLEVLGEIYILQMFALHSLYFATNGDNWTRNDSWLKDPNICAWEGLQCDFPTRVSGLRLSDNNLLGTLTPYLAVGPSLKRIDLSYNEIRGPIPSDFKGLSNLAEINLSYLHLNGTIPADFGSMESLHTLDLSNNSLTGTIPFELRKLRLFTLRLDSNALSGELPPFGGEGNINRRMRFLSVRHNKLGGHIPTDLLTLSNLKYVDLSFNQFKGDPPDFISEASRLEIVNLVSSGFSGHLPDPYCQINSRVIVLGDCRGTARIEDCRCCQNNSSKVLQCLYELDESTFSYITGQDHDATKGLDYLG